MQPFLIAASFTTLLCISAGGVPWIPEPRADYWWMPRHNSYVENTLKNNGSVDVLFYGDSIMEGWMGQGKSTFDQYYGKLNVANYAIFGDMTQHLLWRIKNGEVTEKLDPGLGVLKIGTNNLFPNMDDDNATALGVVFVVKELRERLPCMKLLLLGILPRNGDAWTQRTSNVNNILKYLDNGSTIRFLDMKEHFYHSWGNFVTELYTKDRLHLSEAGYRMWAKVMDPLFREMLG